MIVKHMLRDCLDKLGRRDYLDEKSTTAEEKTILAHLLRGANVVYKELIGSYFPLICEETVKPENGDILTSQLSNHILYAVSVRAGGKELPFKTLPDRISVGEDYAEVAIKYAYDPVVSLTIDDEFACSHVTVDAVSDGILSQYYLYLKMYDLAKFYDASYRDKLWHQFNKNRKNMLKYRGWES